ncbi:hypothetical protein [Selenihalanaerobacter shriftii]|uniref:Uncharacterized protein n=1 Tax=Selenihalanaerobacter shriftii TaxID=142842 RepID=A0A1T4K9F5_9FIRM|nr:hypothetical protein [Selenihalanaerobacter shriftii]SJZ38943.1 hypothetical protein SAMN02745118_00697 [Selenihalanaerobacter shriftii]
MNFKKIMIYLVFLGLLTFIFVGGYSSLVYANENQQILQKINYNYYSLRRLGLQKYNCTFTNNVIADLKKVITLQGRFDDSTKKAVNDLEFYLNYDNGKFGIDNSTYKSTGNLNFDIGFKKMILGTKQSIISFISIWRGFVVEPVFEENSQKYDIKKTKDGYEITIHELKAEATALLNKELRITEVLITTDDTKLKIIPEFIITEQGLLLKGYQTHLNNESMQLNASINYQDVKGLKVLEKVRMESVMPDSRNSLTYNFYNYQLKID